MNVGRNDPCPCGSGRKYKNCCAGKVPWYRQGKWAGLLIALVLLGSVLLFATARPEDDDDPNAAANGRVWSEEHGHWHDLP